MLFQGKLQTSSDRSPNWVAPRDANHDTYYLIEQANTPSFQPSGPEPIFRVQRLELPRGCCTQAKQNYLEPAASFIYFQNSWATL